MLSGGANIIERGHDGLPAAALYWRGGLASPRVSRAFPQPQAQRFKHPRLSLSLELFHNSGARNASLNERVVLVVRDVAFHANQHGDTSWKLLSKRSGTVRQLTRGIFAEHVSETFGDHR